MAKAPTLAAPISPLRWALPALLVIVGLVLFLWYAPSQDPVARPAGVEGTP